MQINLAGITTGIERVAQQLDRAGTHFGNATDLVAKAITTPTGQHVPLHMHNAGSALGAGAMDARSAFQTLRAVADEMQGMLKP